MAIRCRILFRQKRTPERRFDLKQVEIISGHEQTVNIQSVAAAGHPHPHKRVGRHGGKSGVLLLIILEVWIRRRLVALDVIVGGKDLHNFFGIADGQRTKHQGIDDAENGCVRANSENEGEKGND